MAEFLAERQERLLPEYELMKKLQICTEEQIKEFMQKRNNLQIKITQRGKTMRHFVDFIIFEKKVHKWVCEKERALHKNLYGLKSKIAARITGLYRDALRIFPYEERLWHNYIQFCKKSFPNDVIKVYEKMLAFHSDKPAIWCDAGFWLYKFNRNMPKVKDTFFRALQKHPTSEAIYTAFFGILLLDASKKSMKRNLQENTVSEQDIALESLEILYQNAKSKIKNITFYLGLLDLCELRKYVMMTVDLQKIILDDLMDMFPRDEHLWRVLARRELRGYNIDNLIELKKQFAQEEEEEEQEEVENEEKVEVEEEEHNENAVVADEDLDELQQKIKRADTEMSDPEEELTDNEEVEPKSSSENPKKPKIQNLNKLFIFNRLPLGRRIELACKVYKEAVNTLQTPKMWSFYINQMLHLNKNMKVEAAVKRKCLAQAFLAGHESGLMSVEHYATYVRMLLETEAGASRAAKIIEEAVKNTTNAEIYKLLLSVYIHQKNDDKINEIFGTAKNKLGMLDALPVIETVLEYYKEHSEKYLKKLEELYEELCTKIRPEFVTFRANYLQFIFNNEGIKKTRLKYAELSTMPPPCLELHKTMHQLETQAAKQNEKDEKLWRTVHENATYYFGKTKPDVWIDYIEFESQHGDPRRVSNLHTRAVGALLPNLVDTFIMKSGLIRVMSDI